MKNLSMNTRKRKLLGFITGVVARAFGVSILWDEDPKRFERTLVLIQEDGPPQRVYSWNESHEGR